MISTKGLFRKEVRAIKKKPFKPFFGKNTDDLSELPLTAEGMIKNVNINSATPHYNAIQWVLFTQTWKIDVENKIKLGSRTV